MSDESTVNPTSDLAPPSGAVSTPAAPPSPARAAVLAVRAEVAKVVVGQDAVLSGVIAVGGELSTATPSQRGVILVQDDEATTFTLDGRVYDSGGLLGSAGGAGQ